MRPLLRPTVILVLLLAPALLFAQAAPSTDPSEVLRDLAGQWQVVNSRGEVSVWTIEEDGRYRTLFRPKSGQEVRQTGKISVTPQGSIQSRSDKGASAVLTLDRDSSGTQVLRGKGSGLLSTTFEARRVSPSLAGRSAPAQSAPPGRDVPSTKTAGQASPPASLSVVSQEGPLDLVGIKIGMLLPAAIEALKVHDPQLRFSAPKDLTITGITTGDSGPLCIVTQSASFWGVPAYVGHIFCQHFDKDADIKFEMISLELVPGPSLPEVVTGIYREVRWKAGKERAIDTIVPSLKQKYGDHMVLDRGESVLPPGQFAAIWHYDSTGTAVQNKAPSCQQPHSLQVWGGGASIRKSPPSVRLNLLLSDGSMANLLAEAKGCDAYVFASWSTPQSTPKITAGITMVAANTSLKAARSLALLHAARAFEQAEKKKQTEDALKRRDKF
jgi:hypothetical protein